MSKFDFSPTPTPTPTDNDKFYTTAKKIIHDIEKLINENIGFAIAAVVVVAVMVVGLTVAIICCIKAGRKKKIRTNDTSDSQLLFATIDRLERFIIEMAKLKEVTKEENPTNGQSTSPSVNTAPVTTEPEFQVLADSQLFASMERFISEMAKERPIRFSPHQLEAFTRNYSKELGSGGFGVVYEGAFPHGERIAVKVLNSNSSKRVEEQFMAEVSTIGRTYHVNLVRLYGFCFDKTTRALIYEYMENGSLDNLLFNRNNSIEWETLHNIAVGTAKGIAYLHEDCQKRIIHYDIKPGNILLDASFSPKVADFGLAQLCNRESTHVPITGYRGTPGYAAPELWKTDPVTFKCDVYSFGMLLFEVIGRRRNHDVKVSEAREWLPRWTWENFKKGQLGEIMELYTIDEENQEKAERMSMVALWCIQYLPDERPLMSTVVKMLEGVENIIPPPNPFEHLEADSQNVEFMNGDSEWTKSSCFGIACII